ncbi:hypothetical protein [Halobaculum marinum]|uniref:DUF8215 domain-containing protein n=1 Tax=Halobaculum marinum TaxID=3031996 RepID=A0ABD5X610_9EURY|nr:hypothetical protein [Halobaculum sp. DT55]
MSAGSEHVDRRDGGAGKRGRDADWWTSLGYHGVWQVFGLGLPTIWLAFQSPTTANLLGPAAIAGIYGLALGIAAGRQGVLRGDWPRLSRRKLGTGVGYRRVLRRHCLVAGTLALATFGGVLVGRVGGAVVAGATGLVVSLAGAVAFPRLSDDDQRALVGRACLYTAGLAVTVLVARPLDPATAITSAPLTLAFLAATAVVDLRQSVA